MSTLGLFAVSLLSAFFALNFAASLSMSIVVDGEKKSNVSATRKQSNERESIGAFNTRTCGMSDVNFRDHEFVNMAREGQFPWIVSFQIKVVDGATTKEQFKAAKETKKESAKVQRRPMEDLHFCGGSFISDKWILSAAHCFKTESIRNYLKNGKLKVVAGSHKVSSRDAINRNLTIARIYMHSRFDRSRPIGHDIALVELKERVKFTQKRVVSPIGEQSKPFMNAICLPIKGKKYRRQEPARIAGWGLSSEKDVTSMPSKLLTTDLLLHQTRNCVSNYAKALKSKEIFGRWLKNDDVLCASYSLSRDACQSDSGGPLMQYASRKAVVIGIVSYGIGCAKKGVPGVYTKVSAYIDWIRAITTKQKSARVPFEVIEAKYVDSPATPSSTTRRPKVPTTTPYPDWSQTTPPPVDSTTKIPKFSTTSPPKTGMTTRVPTTSTTTRTPISTESPRPNVDLNPTDLPSIPDLPLKPTPDRVSTPMPKSSTTSLPKTDMTTTQPPATSTTTGIPISNKLPRPNVDRDPSDLPSIPELPLKPTPDRVSTPMPKSSTTSPPKTEVTTRLPTTSTTTGIPIYTRSRRPNLDLPYFPDLPVEPTPDQVSTTTALPDHHSTTSRSEQSVKKPWRYFQMDDDRTAKALSTKAPSESAISTTMNGPGSFKFFDQI